MVLKGLIASSRTMWLDFSAAQEDGIQGEKINPVENGSTVIHISVYTVSDSLVLEK